MTKNWTDLSGTDHAKTDILNSNTYRIIAEYETNPNGFEIQKVWNIVTTQCTYKESKLELEKS